MTHQTSIQTLTPLISSRVLFSLYQLSFIYLALAIKMVWPLHKQNVNSFDLTYYSPKDIYITSLGKAYMFIDFLWLTDITQHVGTLDPRVSHFFSRLL